MENPPSERITDLLTSWIEGDREAGERLFTAPLRAAAARGQSPSPRPPGRQQPRDTADLIHDTYIKLTAGSLMPVECQAHFLALASKTMRQIIVDRARRKSALKRDGDLLHVSTLRAVASRGLSAEEIVALDEALEKLDAVEPLLTRIVEMRFFGGATIDETAQALAISTATAKRHWIRAHAFLFQQLRPDAGR